MGGVPDSPARVDPLLVPVVDAHGIVVVRAFRRPDDSATLVAFSSPRRFAAVLGHHAFVRLSEAALLRLAAGRAVTVDPVLIAVPSGRLVAPA